MLNDKAIYTSFDGILDKCMLLDSASDELVITGDRIVKTGKNLRIYNNGVQVLEMLSGIKSVDYKYCSIDEL